MFNNLLVFVVNADVAFHAW